MPTGEDPPLLDVLVPDHLRLAGPGGAGGGGDGGAPQPSRGPVLLLAQVTAMTIQNLDSLSRRWGVGGLFRARVGGRQVAHLSVKIKLESPNRRSGGAAAGLAWCQACRRLQTAAGGAGRGEGSSLG